MDLGEGDYIVGAEVVARGCAHAVDLRNGYGKRTQIGEYRLTNRGGKGVINMKTTARNGMVVGILSVKEDTELMIVRKMDKMIRIGSGEIRQAGKVHARCSSGDLEEGDKVAAACVLPDAPPEEKAPNGQGDLPLQ